MSQKILGWDRFDPLRFPVATRPLQLVDAETREPVADTEEFMGVMRMDTKEVLAPVSEKYSLYPYSDMIDQVHEAIVHLGADCTVDSVGWNGRKSRFIAQLTFPELTYTPPDEDRPIAWRAIISNSYDGALKSGFMSGAYRFWCSNGMVVGIGDMWFTFRHVGAVEDRYQSVLASFAQTMPNAPEVLQREVETFMQPLLKKHQGDKGTAVFFEVLGKKAKLPRKFIDAMTTMATDRDVEDYRRPSTYWHLYNAATNVLSHQTKSVIGSHNLLAQVRKQIVDVMPAIAA